MDIIEILSKELNINVKNLKETVKLIDEGNTIPFIARYRKEVTGNLTDEVLRNLNDRLNYLRTLNEKKEDIKRLIGEKLTKELENQIDNANQMVELEDIYRPFRPKRRTRATIAKEKGLEEVANKVILNEKNINFNDYISEEKGVNSLDDVLSGINDILAEIISDDSEIRNLLRTIFLKFAFISSKMKMEDVKYQNYYDYVEKVSTIKSHRILALNRAEKEGVLSVTIDYDENRACDLIGNKYLKNLSDKNLEIVKNAIIDSYKRLIYPSISREIRNILTEKAEESSLKVFSKNLYQLFMMPPMKGQTILGLDPAFRTGCKVTVIDENGKLLEHTVIYPVEPQNDIENSEKIIKKLIDKYDISLISLGNGTASRETEEFIINLLKKIDKNISYAIVSEAGASVYSASELATKEMKDYDVGTRSSASIARRLLDPMSELVKIDPKSIGVGQYQHDMNQKKLEEELKGTIENCVNSVGVNLNTASVSLLSYVSGINKKVAQNIVDYREKNGKFNNRNDLLKVSGLGQKAFLQSAGFLRIFDGDNILDKTAVHPESYELTKKLLEINNIDLSTIDKGVDLDIDINEASEKLSIGVLTLKDILDELKKPGRDIRESFKGATLRKDVLDIKDVKEGMEFSGTVRNAVDFGVFVDIGVHVDGLLHISKISKNYISHPLDVLSIGDVVNVKVIEIDLKKQRISLSIID